MATKLEGAAREAALKALEVSGWTLVEGREAVTKTFRFRNFSEAFAWMTRAAMIAEKMDHHPEWLNVYNRVAVTLATHSVDGLSDLDVALAEAMDML